MCKTLAFIFGVCFSFVAQAFPCFFTVMKDNCWSDYNVTVNALNAEDGKVLVSAIVPQGSSWTRQQFDCKPGQTLLFQASFNPVFWEKDEGKVYNGISSWALPKAVSGGDTAWNIPVCYPKQFAAVPFPPEGTNSCVCDPTVIPAIQPQ